VNRAASKLSDSDICVVGGAGHVGLPLALLLADAGYRTVIYDTDRTKIDVLRSGRMPFAEQDAETLLPKMLESGRLLLDDTPRLMNECRFLILVIGTPVDEHLNPTFTGIHEALDRCEGDLRDGQILILRSTVYPGMSEHIQRYVRGKGLDISVAFCPERVAQGYSLRESRELPQIISAFDPKTLLAVRQLFSRFVSEFVEMTPMEAELAKLMTNAWRYIQFATINQFYMIATQHGLDFDRILHGCRHKYPRMAGMPGPGFAAGPCLVKDTMQLAAFSHNNFVLGHAAMLINEGLPDHLVHMAKREMDLSVMTAGILGMAFKAESDDTRDSLSYKLKKLLTLETKRVLCTDPYVKDPSFAPLEQVLAEADVLFVGAPHIVYRQLKIPAGKKLIDVWSCVPK
jgi:UDP-N-acetyl-D-mannosaminuronic acid dehydrogenase